MKLRRPALLSMLFLTLLLPAGVYATPLLPSAPIASEGQESTETPSEQVYPGLEKVVPLATELGNEILSNLQDVEKWSDVSDFKKDYQRLKSRWDKEFKEFKTYGETREWPLNRLLNVRAYLGQIEGDAKKLLEKMAAPIESLEESRKRWSEEKTYWQSWQDFLRDSGAKIPRETFRALNTKIVAALDRIEKASAQLLALQQDISATNQQIVSSREEIDEILQDLRERPFQRDAFPLFSSDYFRQFQPELTQRVVSGLKASLQFRSDFLKRQGWLLSVMALTFAILISLLFKFRNVVTDKTDDLHFIFKRPISAALFITLASGSLFLLNVPPFLSLITSSTVAIAVARLAGTLFPERNQRTLLYVLAGTFIVGKALTTLGIPIPLLRLYLGCLSLGGAPFLFWILRRHRRHHDQDINYYQLLLVVGIFIFFTAFIAQISGYATLTQLLLTALVESLFVIIFSLMALRISEGSIELIFKSNLVGSRRFVKNLGNLATNRIVRLFKVLILGVSGLYLLKTWNFYNDIASAWSAIVGFEFTLGEFHLSTGMILLTTAILYASILASWFFQAFLESQVFFGKRIDRGVRDAFKKLSHYALVLVAFLTAMSMAGIELKNFAILAGAFGIGIGFGLQEIINNFVSGLILLFERPIKVGDAIIIDGQWGAINKIGMRSTVVETWEHSEIIVPNSHMIAEKVYNWTLSSNVSRVTISVGVRYGTDLEKVIEILNKVGDGHPAVVAEPAPSAIFTGFGDSSINFELRVWVDDIKHRLSLISDLGVNIDKAFKKAGIEIPYPQRDLHLRSVSPDITLKTSDT